MNRNKIAVAVFAACIMMISLLPCVAAADTQMGPVAITVGAVESAVPGQTVEVPITLSSANGYSAHAVQFVAQYNRLALRLVGFRRGELIAGIDDVEVFCDTASYPGNVYVCILCPGDEAITGDGTLLTLRFRVKDVQPTTSVISLAHGLVSYSPLGGEQADIPTELVNGYVNIIETPPYIYGDANLDGELSFADISAMYAIIIGGEDIPAELVDIADFNRDGSLSFGDISALYSYLIQS